MYLVCRKRTGLGCDVISKKLSLGKNSFLLRHIWQGYCRSLMIIKCKLNVSELNLFLFSFQNLHLVGNIFFCFQNLYLVADARIN